MVTDENAAWAERIVGGAALGDVRRNARGVAVLEALLEHPGASLTHAAGDDDAARERYYRHARSSSVSPDELLRSGCEATAADVMRELADGDDVLLVGDTTSLSYKHSAARALGPTSSSRNSQRRGWQVHTVLAMSAQSGEVWGPVEQLWWSRNPEEHGKKHDRKKRPYDEKESFKWEASAAVATERLVAIRSRTILVTDRESDVYEYLVHLLGEDQRFIVRCSWDRRIEEKACGLFESIAAQPVIDEYVLDIPQKGGRPARQAHLTMRASTVKLRPPQNVASQLPSVPINIVALTEEDPSEGCEPVRWILLTSESVATPEACRKVVDMYARRWRIEEFHKFWKSEGMNVEGLRMTSPENLRRVAVPMAFAAARLMRLRDAVVPPPSRLAPVNAPASLPSKDEVPNEVPHHNHAASAPCTRILTPTQWKVLWVGTEKSPPPETPPTTRWAAGSIAKLGGFGDTKRTGRPGYRTFITGWLRLMDRCELFVDLAQAGCTF